MPFALLCVGAGLQIKAIRADGKYVLIATIIKTVIFPIIVAGATVFLGLEGVAAMILIVYAAVPTATSGYALAKKLGGEAEVMAGIITVQTLISVITLLLALTLASAYFLS